MCKIFRIPVCFTLLICFSSSSFGNEPSYYIQNKGNNKTVTISKRIAQYQDSLLYATAQDDSCKMVEYLYKIGIIKQLKGENDEAFERFSMAYEIYLQFNDTSGIANSLNQLGSIYRYRGSYDRALGNYMQALNMFRALNDTVGQVKVLNNTGITYRLLHDYGKARKNYHRAIQLAEMINTNELATIYNSVGSFYWYQNYNDSALYYYRKALSFAPVDFSLIERRCAILNNIGNVYRNNRLIDSALFFYNRSLVYSDKYGFINLNAITLKNIGKTFSQIGDYSKAFEYLNHGYVKAKKSNLVRVIIEIYFLESRIYEQQNKYKESLEKYKLYSQLQDSVISNRRMKRIAELEVQYQVQKLEKDQAVLQNKIIEKDLSIARTQIFIISAVLVILLLVMVIVLVIIQSRANKRNKKTLEQANNMLEVRVKQRTYSLMLEIEEHKKTEKKLLAAKEKAEESDRLKSAFLSNISHEIRTPMNAIVGFSSLLKSEVDETDVTSEYIKLINNNGIRLLNLIDDIIDLSRIDSNQLILIKEWISIEKLLDKLDKMHRRHVESKGLTFELNRAEGVSKVSIFSDFKRLTQVLSNFISNSIKFTDSGKITIECKQDQNNIEFIISDTGIGIEKENLQDVFKRFRRIENNEHRFFDGAGLGLPLSQEILKLLGGDIEVESVAGKGTRIKVVLPVNPDEKGKS